MARPADGARSARAAGVGLTGTLPGEVRAAVALALATALWFGGCGGGGETARDSGDRTPQVGAATPGSAGKSAETGPSGGEPQTVTTPAKGEDRARITRVVHRYVDSIDTRDGAAACSLLAPGALRGVELPVRHPSCVASLRASIGRPGPTGSPRWLHTTLVDADSVVRVEGGLGRFTGTVVHRFAGSREPSIEDDVIYLRRVGGRWRIAKPSATFYRAIGARDVPIGALRAP